MGISTSNQLSENALIFFLKVFCCKKMGVNVFGEKI
jgi:hypothetical protein